MIRDPEFAHPPMWPLGNVPCLTVNNARLKYLLPGFSDFYPVVRVRLTGTIWRMCKTSLFEFIKRLSCHGTFGFVKSDIQPALQRPPASGIVSQEIQLMLFLTSRIELFEDRKF